MHTINILQMKKCFIPTLLLRCCNEKGRGGGSGCFHLAVSLCCLLFSHQTGRKDRRHLGLETSHSAFIYLCYNAPYNVLYFIFLNYVHILILPQATNLPPSPAHPNQYLKKVWWHAATLLIYFTLIEHTYTIHMLYM